MRTVPLGAAVVKQLREWKMRSKWSKPDDLVFPNRSGTYVRHSHHLNDKFYPLFEKLAELHKTEPAAILCWRLRSTIFSEESQRTVFSTL
jgi:hypothetical protein